jgi:hypothetical protein
MAMPARSASERTSCDQIHSLALRACIYDAAAPVCSPYRAALMTGQYPARVGINDYLRPNDENHLSLDYTTMAELVEYFTKRRQEPRRNGQSRPEACEAEEAALTCSLPSMPVQNHRFGCLLGCWGE